MFSISHALSATDAIHSQLQHEIARTADTEVTADEAAENRLAASKALDALDSTMNFIDNALGKLREAEPPEEKFEPTTPAALPRLPTVALDGVSDGSAASTLGIRFDGAPSDAIKNIVNSMSANKGTADKPTLGDSVPTLSQMATSLGPIIQNFDEVLKKPYLDKYSATINTVPVVGLKGRDIMFVNSTRNPNPVGKPIDAWAVFGPLPANVDITNKTVKFFPYKGNFCLSVGKAVWVRKHREGRTSGMTNDPEIAKAVNNWPYMYVNDWEFIGDEVLPVADPLAVMPYAVLSADRNQIEFQLVVLQQDSTLKFLKGDTLVNKGAFVTLSFQATSGVPTVPAWKQMAYWNDRLVGLDPDNNFWDLKPNFGTLTYTASSKTPIPKPITNLTASDVGPIGIRDDGYMWKRIVAPPVNDGDPTKMEWTQWIQANGVTNLGVASPGVLLDLNLLTSTLRTRYVETQQAIIPLMMKMRAFSLTHTYYLKELLRVADEWNADPSNSVAIEQGKGFVTHAKVWATILGTASNNAKESVNVMTGQFTDIKRQLETLLLLLQDRLAGLRKTLTITQDALDKISAAFWGSVAAAFLGLFIAIAGIVTANPLVFAAGGVLLVAGVASAIAFGIKMTQLAKDLETIKGDIRTTEEATTQLTDVVKNFTSIDNLYKILNTFFGRLVVDSAALSDMDDATAAQLGAEVLADRSSIRAAMDVTAQITTACTTYLDILAAQGIKLPTNPPKDARSAADAMVDSRSVLSQTAGTLESRFDALISTANMKISTSDLKGYQASLTDAFAAHSASLSTQEFVKVATGLWTDVPALNTAGSIWGGFRKLIDLVGKNALQAPQDRLADAESLDEDLRKVQPYVVSMLQQTLEYAKVSESWSRQYPKIPAGADKKIALEYQQKALDACQKAQNSAALANNGFTDFNHKARDYQQRLEAEIAALRMKIDSEIAGRNQAIKNLSPPWYVILGGPVAVIVWMRNETDRINAASAAVIAGLEAKIKELTAALSSTKLFQGHALTWIQMVETVSRNMVKVYGILNNVEGMLMENPVLYAQYMSVQFGDLYKNISDVLIILNAQNPAGDISIQPVPKAASAAAHDEAQLLAMTDGWTAVVSDGSATKNQLLDALCPDPRLAGVLGTQVAKGSDAYDRIQELMQLPYLQSIVAYWDDAQTKKSTLFDIASALQKGYVDSTSREYHAVQKLYSLSILQTYRAKGVQEGWLTLELFVKETLSSVKSALAVAQATSNEFKQSSDEFKAVVKVIQKNITDLEAKIASIDEKLLQADQQMRDKIISEIASCIALAFATAALLIALGTIGPVVAAVNVAAAVGAGAAGAAASIKIVLDGLSIGDLVKTIESLRSSRATLQASLDTFKKVQPYFSEVVTSVEAMSGTVGDMALSLQRLNDNVAIWKEIAIGPAEVKQIGDSWQGVRDNCTRWLDMVNRQGIRPMVL